MVTVSAAPGDIVGVGQAEVAGENPGQKPNAAKAPRMAENPPRQRLALQSRGRSPVAASSVLKISTARDGVMVMALMAEMIVETAMVTANWRKNCPVMPAQEAARNEHGAQDQRDGEDRAR